MAQTIPTANAHLTQHDQLHQWVNDVAGLCQPEGHPLV